MKRPIRVIAALIYITFFIAIIVIADRGEGNRWWSFINHIPCGDKVGHLGLIGMLSLLCNLAITPRPCPLLPRFITLTTAILLAILSLEEIAQAFLPHRSCDLFDWLANIAGLTLGQFFATLIRRRFVR